MRQNIILILFTLSVGLEPSIAQNQKEQKLLNEDVK